METFSVMLFTNLCRYIGTQEQIYIRRNWGLFHEKVQKIMYGIKSDWVDRMLNCEQKDNIQIMFSGSRAEGLRLPGSDYDVMYVFAKIAVLPTSGTNLHQPDLIMETLNLKPGFVRLRITDRFIYLQPYSDCITMLDNTLYFSSTLFSNIAIRAGQLIHPNFVLHGPCATVTNDFNTDQDFALCISCRLWPAKASEWTHRNRPYNWPSTELVHCIVNDGCLLVPIGNRNSEFHHIEWRISFSVAERKLVFSMNHTQFLCYGLLKLYLKHVIESNEAVKDLLCSYFLKTCLFYCMEESDVRWEKENFINCFWTCFRLLYSWVRDGYCPNYFIRDNNMFEGKIFGDQQAKLLDHLSNLYSDGIDTFVLIPCLRDFISRFRGSFYPVLNRNLEFSIPGTELECWVDAETFAAAIDFDKYPPILLDLVSGIVMIESNRMSSSLDSTFKTMRLFCYKHMLTQTLYHKYVYNATSNKDRYKHLKMLHNFIQRECTDDDICTGWLQYATLCYVTGQYDTVIRIVKHVLKQFKPYTMYLGVEAVLCDKDAYIENISGQGLTILQKMKLVLASTYEINSICCCYPREIEYEILHNSYEVSQCAFIPPVVYSNVLLFLSYKRLGYTYLVTYTLNELHEAAHSDRFVTNLERPIALALLDKCVHLHYYST